MPSCVHCKEEVQFETDRDGDLICESCGWSQSTNPQTSNRASAYKGMAKPGMVKIAAALLLVQGLLALGSFIGLVDLWLAVGVFRRKEKQRSFAVTLAVIQLVIATVAIAVFAAAAFREPLLTTWLYGYLAVLPLWVPMKIATIVILTRQSVKDSFLD